MRRYRRTVAGDVNNVLLLVKPDEIAKAHMITQIILDDRGSKKWNYLRRHLQSMKLAEIHAFADQTDSVFADKIARTEYL